MTTIQEIQQQRVSIEQRRRQLLSERSARQVQNINQLLKRQQALAQTAQQSQTVNTQLAQLQAEQLRQQQQTQSRSSIKQEALRVLLEKGKGSSELYSLSPQERAEVESIASELKSQAQRNQARTVVSQAKAEILKSDPDAIFGRDFEQAVYQEALKKSGNIDLTITQTVPASMLVDNAQFKYMPQQTQKEIIKTPLFKNTPYVYPVIDKAKQIYESPTAVKIRQGLSGESYAKAQATSGNKIIYNLNTGVAEFKGNAVETPEYERAVQSSMTGQILSSAVLGSITGVPRVPTSARIPIRQPENIFFEVQQPVLSKGRRQTVSSYQVVEETRPPSILLSSRDAGGLLGNTDKLKVVPAKYKITTGLPSVVGEPVIAVTTSTGKTAVINSLTGEAVNIEAKNINKLPKIQQYLFKQLGKEKPIVPEDTQFSVGGINQQNINIGLRTKGKSTSRYAVTSTTNPFIETPEYTQYQTSMKFKDITFPNARATGNVASLKGQIRVMKNTLILDDVKEVNFIKPNPNIKKTPLSVTFQRQELIQTPKPLSDVPKAKTQIILIKTPSKSNGNIGLLSGSVSRNTNGASSSFSNDFLRGLQDYTKSKTTAQETPRTEVIDLALPKTSQVSFSVPKQITSEMNIFVPKDNVIESTISIESPKQTSSLINLLRSAQTQQQKQTLRTLLKSKYGEIPIPKNRPPNRPTPKTPRKRLPFLPDGIISLNKTKGVKDILGFQAEVRRKGKFTPLGKSESTLGRALLKAQGYTDVTLARSFRIRNVVTGELVSPSSVGSIFRSSSKEAKTFIELPRYSLGGSELREIEFFKKKKRRKNAF